MNKKTKLYQEWLERAADDASAITAILNEDASPNTACFLAQQMSEKILKGLLAYEDQKIPKTHDLLELAAIVRDRYPRIDELIKPGLQTLNKYYISTRYPGDYPDFTRADAESALEAAVAVRQFAESIKAIHEGLADVNRGKTRPFEDVLDELGD